MDVLSDDYSLCHVDINLASTTSTPSSYSRLGTWDLCSKFSSFHSSLQHQTDFPERMFLPCLMPCIQRASFHPCMKYLGLKTWRREDLLWPTLSDISIHCHGSVPVVRQEDTMVVERCCSPNATWDAERGRQGKGTPVNVT